MILWQRAPASILLLVLLVSTAHAQAEGEICTSDAPDTPPVAVARQPSGHAKIEWRDVVWGDRNGQMVHAEKPYQSGRMLEGESLYLALDRPELAQAYRQRQETQTGLRVASGLFLVTGAIAAGIVEADQRGGRSAPAAPALGAVVSIVLGGVLGIAGIAYSPADVVTDAELHRLVDAHNQAQ